MIRAALFLTLALAVATGESAALLCQAFCDRAAVAGTGGCHHAQSAATIELMNDVDCTSADLPAMATPRVELDRADSRATTPDTVSNELLVTTFRRLFAPAVSFLCVGSPPRSIALRI